MNKLILSVSLLLVMNTTSGQDSPIYRFPPCQRAAVVFVVDHSSSQDNPVAQHDVCSFLESITIVPPNQGEVYYTLLTYNDDLYVKALNETNYEEFKSEAADNCAADLYKLTTRTHVAFEAAGKIFSEFHEGYHKIIFWVSDGRSNSSIRTNRVAESLRALGVQIFAFGSNARVDEKEMVRVSGGNYMMKEYSLIPEILMMLKPKNPCE